MSSQLNPPDQTLCRIGVISDTHNFFDPQIPGVLSGVDYIFHAGDIGLPRILTQLGKIAPVSAVGGNTDEPGFNYRLNQMIELAGRRFLLQHIVNPHHPDDALLNRLEKDRPEVVIFGHTHKPFSQMLGPTLFFNPGYAGKQRFNLPRTLAVLHCARDSISPEFFPL